MAASGKRFEIWAMNNQRKWGQVGDATSLAAATDKGNSLRGHADYAKWRIMDTTGEMAPREYSCAVKAA